MRKYLNSWAERASFGVTRRGMPYSSMDTYR